MLRVGIITAIASEYSAVRSFLSDLSDEAIEGVTFGRGRIRADISPALNKTVAVYLPAPSSAGNVSAAILAARLARHRLDLIAMIGCAGGIPKKVNLYDVVFADKVIYYEPGKATEDAFIARPDQHKPFDELIQRAKVETASEDWKRFTNNNVNSHYYARVEPLAAGECLVNSTNASIMKHIKAVADRAVAVEMEGFGLLEAAHRMDVPAVVVRGVSDLLDKRPDDELDQDGHVAGFNPRQVQATSHAMAFFCQILSKADISRLAGGNERESEPTTDLYIEVSVSADQFAQVLADLSSVTGGLPLRNIRIMVGSIKIVAESDPVLAASLQALWAAGVFRRLGANRLVKVHAGEPRGELAAEIADLIHSAIKADADQAQFAITRILWLGQEHQRYRAHLAFVRRELRNYLEGESNFEWSAPSTSGRMARVSIRLRRDAFRLLQRHARELGMGVHGAAQSALARATKRTDHPILERRLEIGNQANVGTGTRTFTISLSTEIAESVAFIMRKYGVKGRARTIAYLIEDEIYLDRK